MKKINIAEILKDCPKGMELDCACADNVVFDKIIEYDQIKCVIGESRDPLILDKYGRLLHICCPKCVIFPKGKTTWEGFQRPFKDGDIITCTNSNCTFVAIYKDMYDEYSFNRYVCLILNEGMRFSPDCTYSDFANPRLATEEEKQKLFDAIKANGYKWNPETKTLKELKVVMRMWISRGEGDNYCVLFKEKPYKYYDKLCKKHFFKTDNMYGTYMCLPAGYFPSVTFENSPQQVEIKLI